MMRTATILFTLLTAVSRAQVGAQEMRTRTPNPNAPPPTAGIPRNSKFPYEGVWTGRRVMPMGSDELTLRLVVQGDKYLSIMLLPDGHPTPERPVTATSAGLVWDQANSGGGNWMYKVQLASPDSLVGTLVLNNAPPNLTPAPTGTIVLKRVPATRND